MEEMQAKIDELKETMPSETYRQLCQETKRVREMREVPLFEVKYISNTYIASHNYSDDEGSQCQCLSAGPYTRTKIMRGVKGYWNTDLAPKYFDEGKILLTRDGGEIYDNYEPGLQFTLGKPGILVDASPYLTVYTILEIKPFTTKRTRTDDNREMFRRVFAEGGLTGEALEARVEQRMRES